MVAYFSPRSDGREFQIPFVFLIIILRATLDVNREKNEAAQSCSNAEQAYDIYHNTIKSVINGFTQGKGVLFDIHGQVWNTIFVQLKLF